MTTDEQALLRATESTMKVVESAVDQLWSVVNELSRIRPEREQHYRVAIFGSARIQPGTKLYEDVKLLAARLSAMGCDIVTGGGPGLMQAANEGEKIGDPEDRTRSIGIRIELPFEQGANAFVERLYTHRTFYSRLAQFMRLSHAFVIVPGGIGTTLESLMVWQLLQVRHLHNVPLIFVGPMWKEFVIWAQRHMVDVAEPLAGAADISIPICVDEIEKACDLIEPLVRQFQARPGAE